MSGHAETIPYLRAMLEADERHSFLAALDALLAENQRLREDRDRWREYCEAETVALDASKAENQRLRDALKQIAAISPNSNYMRKAWLIADEALAGDTE